MYYDTKRHWTQAEENFVTENVGRLSPAEMGKQLNRTETSVVQFMHRKRINLPERVSRNLVKEMLTAKFTNPEYFKPVRQFYEAVGINQKRWWDLYAGRQPVTDEEYRMLSAHFGVELDGVDCSRQLNLFEDVNTSRDN